MSIYIFIQYNNSCIAYKQLDIIYNDDNI